MVKVVLLAIHRWRGLPLRDCEEKLNAVDDMPTHSLWLLLGQQLGSQWLIYRPKTGQNLQSLECKIYKLFQLKKQNKIHWIKILIKLQIKLISYIKRIFTNSDKFIDELNWKFKWGSWSRFTTYSQREKKCIK